MITNSREYQITQSQIARLREALRAAKSAGPADGVHPRIHQAELEALGSELGRLDSEVSDYEALLDGSTFRLTAVTLDELPLVLIKARIANKLTQKQLAEKLDVHEQQIQRYESSLYRGVAFDRLREIAQILGVKIEGTALLATPVLRRARKNLRDLGMSDAFLERRILTYADSPTGEPDDSAKEVARLSHVFGCSVDELASRTPLHLPAASFGAPLYKLPPGRDSSYVEAYSAYAYRLACGAALCARHLPKNVVPESAERVRSSLLEKGPLTLRHIVDWAWDQGVVLLPLPDRAAFHAAFWRIDGRNVIIIKQRTDSAERLMHDTLHELFHASQDPESSTRAVFDDESAINREDGEEVDAATFASDVLLDGRANALVQAVASSGNRRAEFLKAAVGRVARQNNVPVGALANHLAWVLAQQRPPVPWWATAQTLQEHNGEDLAYARQAALDRLIPPPESSLDAELLYRALRDEGGP